MLSFLAPYKLIIIIIAVAALFGTIGTVAYNKGYSRAEDAAAKRELAAVQRAVEQAQAVAAQDAEISAGNLVNAEKIRVVFRDAIKGARQHAIKNPLPDNCVLDPERMRRITDNISGKVAAVTPATDSTVPGATDTGKQ